MKRIITILTLVVAIVTGCSHNTLYEETRSVNHNGWAIDSVAKFSFDVTDTTARYDISFVLRNAGDYEYQNLWLFVKNIEPDLTSHNDTVQLMLADDYGRWVGTGIGSIYSATYDYRHGVRFPQAGNYQIFVQQGMRTDSLAGIYNVGVKITRHQEKNGKK